MNFNDFATLAQFAEKVGTNATNVKNWVEKAEVKPVHKFGNTNVYSMVDLSKAMEEHSRNADGFRKLGYIHPDQHKAVQDMHTAAVRELIELQSQYNTLLANFNGVQAELDQLQNSLIINGSEGELDMSVFETSE